ncbi:MAG: hypothetical protein K0R71_1633 [Bacillales bacterium]|jgi:hypothetical protein|nr:hypothetical protein [Bacillales bacterium]
MKTNYKFPLKRLIIIKIKKKDFKKATIINLLIEIQMILHLKARI